MTHVVHFNEAYMCYKKIAHRDGKTFGKKMISKFLEF